MVSDSSLHRSPGLRLPFLVERVFYSISLQAQLGGHRGRAKSGILSLAYQDGQRLREALTRGQPCRVFESCHIIHLGRRGAACLIDPGQQVCPEPSKTVCSALNIAVNMSSIASSTTLVVVTSLSGRRRVALSLGAPRGG